MTCHLRTAWISNLREIDGVVHANDGDWVEHCTAVAENRNGQLRPLQWQACEPRIMEESENETLAA